MVLTVVVAYSHEPSGGSLDRYVEAQLAGVAGTIGGHLLSLQASRRPVPHLELALAVDLMGFDLTVVQRHLLRADGSSVTATGMAADVDWPDVAAELTGAVRSLRIPEAVDPAARRGLDRAGPLHTAASVGGLDRPDHAGPTLHPTDRSPSTGLRQTRATPELRLVLRVSGARRWGRYRQLA